MSKAEKLLRQAAPLLRDLTSVVRKGTYNVEFAAMEKINRLVLSAETLEKLIEFDDLEDK